ncbi:MAG: hypothetical protein HUJ96_02955 [Marinilabiliaceae bacterium]|mgnify:FL=1|nr:hypothetical protein [Marinilabiliaceae bacterium]
MGRNSGGNREAFNDGGGNYDGSIKNVETLKNIKNPAMYKSVKEAISRYHSVLGVREREIKLATLSDDVMGVCQSINGERAGVFLNKKYFKNKTPQEQAAVVQQNVKNGFLTQTNRPSTSVLLHELAHSTWNTHLNEPNVRSATNEIERLYKTWKADRRKVGYGKYAKSNVDEFWAETVQKAVSGNQDKYTRAVKKICKKYKL